MEHIIIHGASYNFETKKTIDLPTRKIYLYRMNYHSAEERQKRFDWCRTTLEGGRDSWWIADPTIYFADQTDYLMFLLKWS